MSTRSAPFPATDLHRPAGGRAADRHGPALLEPPFPQHARRRRPAGQPISCARSPRPAMTGPLSLEIFNDQFRGGSPKSIAVDGRRSLIYLMDQVARAEPEIAIGVTSDARSDRGRMASSSSNSRPMKRKRTNWRRCSHTMGFRLAARHKHKEVRSTGKAASISSSTRRRRGFAHSSYVVHGTSAYAFGLKVEDAEATVDAGKGARR